VKVVFSDQAKVDLMAIGDHIAKDSRRRAVEFIERLEAQALEIGLMPAAFPLIPRHEHRDIRRRPFGNYLIFYRAEKSVVFIVRILHGAMDYESLLFDA
jgi:toxin ParE1/3/4